MNKRFLTILVWGVAVAAIVLLWQPLSYVKSGDRLTMDLEIERLVALIVITVIAWLFYRRFR
jgi:MFS superfamily sulfate permease-like transporter